MKEEDSNIEVEEKEKEIDLLELGIRLWDSKRQILLWALCGAIIGLIVAISIPREYTTSVKLVPETGEARSGGNLSALAAFAGVNIGTTGSNDAMGPNMYPDIVSSTPFIVDMFSVKLPTDVPGDTLTLEEIITSKTKRPWWTVITSFVTSLPSRTVSLFSSNNSNKQSAVSDSIIGINPFKLTRAQEGIVGGISSRVTSDVSRGVVSINVMLQDATASANLADTVARRLQEYIKDYRTEKARNDLKYAEKLNEEAREDYFNAQQEYAKFVDRNQGLSNRTAALELERLQNEMQLAFNLYNSTSQQVQIAKAKVQSNTPVFSVIKPASIPNKPSKPRKMMIIIGFMFVAVVLCSAIILFAPGIKSSIREKKSQMESNTD